MILSSFAVSTREILPEDEQQWMRRDALPYFCALFWRICTFLFALFSRISSDTRQRVMRWCVSDHTNRWTDVYHETKQQFSFQTWRQTRCWILVGIHISMYFDHFLVFWRILSRGSSDEEEWHDTHWSIVLKDDDPTNFQDGRATIREALKILSGDHDRATFAVHEAESKLHRMQLASLYLISLSSLRTHNGLHTIQSCDGGRGLHFELSSCCAKILNVPWLSGNSYSLYLDKVKAILDTTTITTNYVTNSGAVSTARSSSNNPQEADILIPFSKMVDWTTSSINCQYKLPAMPGYYKKIYL